VRATAAGLSAEIRRYCAAHPNAADTLEGIAWWLAMQRYTDVLKEVRDAIDQLVDDGVLMRHQTHDGVSVYGCRPSDTDEPGP
jgi:hypothetical protein